MGVAGGLCVVHALGFLAGVRHHTRAGPNPSPLFPGPGRAARATADGAKRPVRPRPQERLRGPGHHGRAARRCAPARRRPWRRGRGDNGRRVSPPARSPHESSGGPLRACSAAASPSSRQTAGQHVAAPAFDVSSASASCGPAPLHADLPPHQAQRDCGYRPDRGRPGSPHRRPRRPLPLTIAGTPEVFLRRAPCPWQDIFAGRLRPALPSRALRAGCCSPGDWPHAGRSR